MTMIMSMVMAVTVGKKKIDRYGDDNKTDNGEENGNGFRVCDYYD